MPNPTYGCFCLAPRINWFMTVRFPCQILFQNYCSLCAEFSVFIRTFLNCKAVCIDLLYMFHAWTDLRMFWVCWNLTSSSFNKHVGICSEAGFWSIALAFALYCLAVWIDLCLERTCFMLEHIQWMLLSICWWCNLTPSSFRNGIRGKCLLEHCLTAWNDLWQDMFHARTYLWMLNVRLVKP